MISLIPTQHASPVHPPALFAFLAAMLVCGLPNVLADGDTYTHIAAGSWMLEHWTVLRSDPFSSTFAGQPWVAHEWLSEVLLAGAYRLGGLTGVVLLAAGAAALAMSTLARHIGRWNCWTGTVLLTSAALFCAVTSFTARPHLLALSALEVWVAGLLVARQEARPPPWWLLAVMVVWANLHGGFAFGIAVAVPFAVEASWAGRGRLAWRWWVFVAGAVAAGLLTPQGLEGLLFPWRLLQLRSLSAIQEWQPASLTSDPGFEIAVLGLVALLGTGRVRLGGLHLLLLLGLLHLTLMHSRHSLLFGVVGALVVAEPAGLVLASLGRGSRRATVVHPGRRALGWAAAAAVLVLRAAHPMGAADAWARPVSALAQVPLAVAAAPMLNSYQFGGYLALRGLRPFVDGRLELFGDRFIDDFRALSQPGENRLAQAVDRYGIGWALLAVGDPLVGRFEGLEGWRRQYADEVAVVFVRG